MARYACAVDCFLPQLPEVSCFLKNNCSKVNEFPIWNEKSFRFGMSKFESFLLINDYFSNSFSSHEMDRTVTYLKLDKMERKQCQLYFYVDFVQIFMSFKDKKFIN